MESTEEEESATKATMRETQIENEAENSGDTPYEEGKEDIEAEADAQPQTTDKSPEELFLESLPESVLAEAEKKASKAMKTEEKEKKQRYRSLAGKFKVREPAELVKAVLETEIDDDFFRNGGGAMEYLKLLLSKDDNVIQAALTALARQLYSTDENPDAVIYDDGLDGETASRRSHNLVDAIAVLTAAEEGTKWNATEIFVRHFFSRRPAISILSLRCYRLLLDSVATFLPVYCSVRWKWLTVMLTAGDSMRRMLEVVAAGIASEKTGAWASWCSYYWECHSKGEEMPAISFSAKELKQVETPCVAPTSPETVLEAAKCLYIAITEVFNPLRQNRNVGCDIELSDEYWKEIQDNRCTHPPDLKDLDIEGAVLKIINQEGKTSDDEVPFVLTGKESLEGKTVSEETEGRLQSRAQYASFLGSSQSVAGTTNLDVRHLEQDTSHFLQFSQSIPWHPLREAFCNLFNEEIRVSVNTGPLNSKGAVAGSKYYGKPLNDVQYCFSVWSFHGMELLRSLANYKILAPLHGSAYSSVSKDYAWCLSESEEIYSPEGAHSLLPISPNSVSEVIKEISQGKSKSQGFLERVAVMEHKRSVVLESSIQCYGWKVLDTLTLHEHTRGILQEDGIWKTIDDSLQTVRRRIVQSCLQLQFERISRNMGTNSKDEEVSGTQASAETEQRDTASGSTDMDRAINILTQQKLKGNDLSTQVENLKRNNREMLMESENVSRIMKHLDLVLSSIESLLETIFHLGYFCSQSTLSSIIEANRERASYHNKTHLVSATTDDSTEDEKGQEEEGPSSQSSKRGSKRNSSTQKKRRQSVTDNIETERKIVATSVAYHTRNWDSILSPTPPNSEELEDEIIRLLCQFSGIPFHQLFTKLIQKSLGNLRWVFNVIPDDETRSRKRSIAAGECKVVSTFLRTLRNPATYGPLRDHVESTLYCMFKDKNPNSRDVSSSTKPHFRFPRELWKMRKQATHCSHYNSFMELLSQQEADENLSKCEDEILGDSILYKNLGRSSHAMEGNQFSDLLDHVTDNMMWGGSSDSNSWLSIRDVISLVCTWSTSPRFEYLGGGLDNLRKQKLFPVEALPSGDTSFCLGPQMSTLLTEMLKEVSTEEDDESSSTSDPILLMSLLIPGSENLLATVLQDGKDEESSIPDTSSIYFENAANIISAIVRNETCSNTEIAYNPLQRWCSFMLSTTNLEKNDLVESFLSSSQDNHDSVFLSGCEEVGCYLLQECCALHSVIPESSSVAAMLDRLQARRSHYLPLGSSSGDKSSKKAKDSKASAKKGKGEKTSGSINDLIQLAKIIQPEEALPARLDTALRATRFLDRLTAPASTETGYPELISCSSLAGRVGGYGIVGMLVHAPLFYLQKSYVADSAFTKEQMSLLVSHSLRLIRKLILCSPIETAVLGSFGNNVADAITCLAAPPTCLSSLIEGSEGEKSSLKCDENVLSIPVYSEEIFVGRKNAFVLDMENGWKTDLRSEAMETLCAIAHADRVWRYYLPQEILYYSQNCGDWEKLWSSISVDTEEGKGEKKSAKKGAEKGKSEESSPIMGTSWSPGHRAAVNVGKHVLYLLATYGDVSILQRMGQRWSETLLETVLSMLQVRGVRSSAINWLLSCFDRSWLSQLQSLCNKFKELLPVFQPLRDNQEQENSTSKWRPKLTQLASGFAQLDIRGSDQELLEAANKQVQEWQSTIDSFFQEVCNVLLPCRISDFLGGNCLSIEFFPKPSFYNFDTASMPWASGELQNAVHALVGEQPSPGSSKKSDDKKKGVPQDDTSKTPETPEQQLAFALGLNIPTWFSGDSKHLCVCGVKEVSWVFGRHMNEIPTDIWGSFRQTVDEFLELDIDSKMPGQDPAPAKQVKGQKGKKGTPRESEKTEDSLGSEIETQLYTRVCENMCSSLKVLQCLLRVLCSVTHREALENHITQEIGKLKQHKNDDIDNIIANFKHGISETDKEWTSLLCEHPSLPEQDIDSVLSLFKENSSSSSKEKKKASPRGKEKNTNSDAKSVSPWDFCRFSKWRCSSPLVFPKVFHPPLQRSYLHGLFSYMLFPSRGPPTHEWSQDHLYMPRHADSSARATFSDAISVKQMTPPLDTDLLSGDYPLLTFGRLLESSRASICSDIIGKVFYEPFGGSRTCKVPGPLNFISYHSNEGVELCSYPIRQSFTCASLLLEALTSDYDRRLGLSSLVSKILSAEAVRSGTVFNVFALLDDFREVAEKTTDSSIYPDEVQELLRILDLIFLKPFHDSNPENEQGVSWVDHWALLLGQNFPCSRFSYVIARSDANDTTDGFVLQTPTMTMLHLASSLCSDEPMQWLLGKKALAKGIQVYKRGLHTIKKHLPEDCTPTWCDCVSEDTAVNPFGIRLDCLDENGRTPAALSFCLGKQYSALALIYAGAPIDCTCDNGDPLLKYSMCSPSAADVKDLIKCAENSPSMLCSPFPPANLDQMDEWSASHVVNSTGRKEKKQWYRNPCQLTGTMESCGMPLLEAGYESAVCFSILLAAGASCQQADSSGSNCLHWLASQCVIEAHLKSTVAVLSATTDIKYREAILALIGKLGGTNVLDLPNVLGETPLHCAIAHGYARMGNQLLNLGAHPNVIDKQGNLPLHYAALGRDETAQMSEESADDSSPILMLVDRLLGEGSNYAIRPSNYFKPVSGGSFSECISKSLVEKCTPLSLHEIKRTACELLRWENNRGVCPLHIMSGLMISGFQFYRLGVSLREDVEHVLPSLPHNLCVQGDRARIFASTSDLMSSCVTAWSAAVKWMCNPVPISLKECTEDGRNIFLKLGNTTPNESTRKCYAATAAIESRNRTKLLESSLKRVMGGNYLVSLTQSCISSWCDINDFIHVNGEYKTYDGENEAEACSQNPYADETVELQSFQLPDDQSNEECEKIAASVRPVYPDHDQSSLKYHHALLSRAFKRISEADAQDLGSECDQRIQSIQRLWQQSKHECLDHLLYYGGEEALNGTFIFFINGEKLPKCSRLSLTPLSMAVLLNSSVSGNPYRLTRPEEACWTLLKQKDLEVLAFSYQPETELYAANVTDPFAYVLSPAPAQVVYPTPLQLATFSGCSEEFVAYLLKEQLALEDRVAVSCYENRMHLLDQFSRGVMNISPALHDENVDSATSGLSDTSKSKVPNKALVRAEMRRLERNLYDPETADISWPDPRWDDRMPITEATWALFGFDPQEVQSLRDVASLKGDERQVQFYDSLPPLHL